MKIYGHFRAANGAAFYGEFGQHDSTVRALRQAPWLGIAYAEAPPHTLADLAIDVPVAPRSLLAVGRNYAEHAKELGNEPPPFPLTWLKSPGSLLAHNGVIELPFPEHVVHYEAELAVILGRTARNVRAAEAADYIFGYAIALDISDRNLQTAEGQFYRSKSFDGFTPFGPYIYVPEAGDFDPGNLAVQLKQNGELRQDGNTRDMIFKPADVLEFSTKGTTLIPGDVLITGTPAGVGPIKDGDVLEARIGPFAPLVARVKNA
ncbi:MAG: fumarylacetoacetate hydrolase family protein [Verrucomicrobia bacterium]|nr:fumarylacetoacetate hydrolase family protein [Verrucomicrobiota bacterium]